MAWRRWSGSAAVVTLACGCLPGRARCGTLSAVLAVSDFLSALSDADRDALLTLGSVRRYRGGVTVLHEHDDAGGVLVILEGQVAAAVVGRAVRRSYSGSRGL